MIYVYGSNSGDHYNCPHSGTVQSRDLAHALNFLGRPAIALWSGTEGVVGGVPHGHALQVRPKPEDVLIVTHVNGAALVVSDPGYAHLRIPTRRILYTSSFVNKAQCDSWVGVFQHVFVECASHAPDIQAACGIPTDPCQIGCTADVDLSDLPNPYPAEGKHLFFAGRLSLRNLGRLQVLAGAKKFHVWIAAPSVELPPGIDVPEVPSIPWKECYGAWMFPGSAAPKFYDTPIGKIAQLHGRDAAAVIEAATGRHPLIHALGALPYGTFWHYHFHAHASLDFGFLPECVKVPNNSKIVDMVRSGARIVAEGWSPTYYLLEKYKAGYAVPYEDTPALVTLLDNLGPEDPRVRRMRGTRMAVEDSWAARLPMMLDVIDSLPR